MYQGAESPGTLDELEPTVPGTRTILNDVPILQLSSKPGDTQTVHFKLISSTTQAGRRFYKI